MNVQDLNRSQLELAYHYSVPIEEMQEVGSNEKGTFIKRADGTLYMSAYAPNAWPCTVVGTLVSDTPTYYTTKRWR